MLHVLKAPLWGLCLAVALLLPLVAGCGERTDSFVGGRGGRVIATVERLADIQIVRATAAPRVAVVRPIPQLITVARGGVAIFTATARDRQGRLLAGVEFRWRMRDRLAGVITEHGVFTAGSAPGAYSDAIVVEARHAGGQEFTAEGSASVIITSGIEESRLASVVIFPRSPELRPGDRTVFTAVAFGHQGGLLQNVTLVWRLLDPQVGTIESNGVFIAGQTPGIYADSLEVQARVRGQPPVTDRVAVTVLSAEELRDGVRALMAPALVVGAPGESRQLSLRAIDIRGIPVSMGEIQWRVVTPGAGQITADGRLIIGDTPGTYQGAVEATAALTGDYAGRTVTATSSVVVQRPEELGGVLGTEGQTFLSPEVLRLRQGERQRFSLVNLDNRGFIVIPDEVQWTADPEVAVVSSRGTVTAIAPPGTYPGAVQVEISDRTTEGGPPRRVTATLVVLGLLSRVEVRPARAVLEPGDLIQLQATAFDANGARLFDVSFRWEMADDRAGIITSGGLFTAGDRPGEYPGAIRVRVEQREAG